MLGAIVVTALGDRFVLRQPKPLMDDNFSVPTRTDADGRLVMGAAIFGIGGGPGGDCPGPAIASIGFGAMDTVVFVIFMAIGMIAGRALPTVPKTTPKRTCRLERANQVEPVSTPREGKCTRIRSGGGR